MAMTTALVIIDMQQGMFTDVVAPHRGEEVLQRCADLLDRARSAGVPVFHVQHDGSAGDPLQKGTPGFPHHPAVAPRADEPVIVKKNISAFHGTDFDQQLKKKGIDRLVIAGMQTDFCIDSACRVAKGLGYEVVLADDAHTTFDNKVLPAERIVAHHNATLDGAFVELAKSADIQFKDR
jgi:nicotinamidase-related amidase